MSATISSSSSSSSSLVPIFDKPNTSHETLFKWLYDAVADECSGNMQHAWKHLNKDTLDEVFNYRSIVKGYSILHRAIESKQNQNVRFLLQNGFPVKDTYSVDGLTPLLLAIQTKNVDISKELLALNIDSTDDIGNTPLHYAIQYNMDKNFIKDIIELKKELVEMPNLSGLYPIHFACIYNRLDILHFFTQTFRVVDKFWNSPLMYASKMGHLEMVEALVKESEPLLKNNMGKTAIDIVGNEASLSIPMDLEKIKQILSSEKGRPEEQHRLELEHLHKIREVFQQRCDKLHNHKVNRLERDLGKLYDLLNLIREKQKDLETRYESLMQLLKK